MPIEAASLRQGLLCWPHLLITLIYHNLHKKSRICHRTTDGSTAISILHLISFTFLDKVLKVINWMLLNLTIKFLTETFINQRNILNFPAHKFQVAGELTVCFDLHLKKEELPRYMLMSQSSSSWTIYMAGVLMFYLSTDFSTSTFT